MATLGPRIASVHVHDNKGLKDEHLWPGDGTIPWPATIEALKRLAAPPASVLEIHHTLGNETAEVSDRIEKAFQLFAKRRLPSDREASSTNPTQTILQNRFRKCPHCEALIRLSQSHFRSCGSSGIFAGMGVGTDREFSGGALRRSTERPVMPSRWHSTRSAWALGRNSGW